jgi:Mce-associated membrane protein
VTTAVADPETLSSPNAPQEVEEQAANTPAPWWVRAVALVVDVLPGAAVVTTMALAALGVPLRGVWWWSCVVIGGIAMLLTAANRSLLPASTGWSLGRAALRIRVVRGGDVSAGSVGAWRLLLREMAHVLDTASVLVGWLWPLWDERRRTFADMLVHTESRRVELRRAPKDAPALAAAVSLTAALVCIMGAAVSYRVVYQYDQASEKSHAQIASQGPKIVAEMLSYRAHSLSDDFARAQSLVTDKYREQLEAEQQAVQKKKPVANQYWVTNSSVLSASPHHATMLLFLQGQRGDPGNERPISATVRVAFAESRAQWRVDDLSVLSKPLPAEDGN